MPSRDHHVMMTLHLGCWSQDHRLRAFEIERDLAAARQHCPPKRRTGRFSLGNLKLLWSGTA